MPGPPPPSPPSPPPTAESAIPSPTPPPVGPHEGADTVKAPVTSAPPSAPEPETDEADSGMAPALPEGPVLPSTPGVANSGQPATIPRPTYEEEQQAGFPFDLLGIGRDKVDREPIRTCMTEVYRGQARWRTSTNTYKELPEEESGAAEQQLQRELEKLYPATPSVADQVRACREWLPGVLLARRHRNRRNTWARRKVAA